MAGIGALSILSKAALAVSAAGTIINTANQISAAKDAKNIANINAENTRRISEYNAAIAEQSAGQEEAASQLRAKEAQRQARLKQSRVLALVAASGGGAMDTDVMNIISGFGQEGDLESRTELYQGSENARQLRAKAKAGIWQGETEARSLVYEGMSKSSALRNQAVGTIMTGAGSLYSKYREYQ